MFFSASSASKAPRPGLEPLGKASRISSAARSPSGLFEPITPEGPRLIQPTQ